jgi:hypothetical protein
VGCTCSSGHRCVRSSSRWGPAGGALKTIIAVLWAIDHANAEVMILRPAPQDTRVISADGVAGHF